MAWLTTLTGVSLIIVLPGKDYPGIALISLLSLSLSLLLAGFYEMMFGVKPRTAWGKRVRFKVGSNFPTLFLWLRNLIIVAAFAMIFAAISQSPINQPKWAWTSILYYTTVILFPFRSYVSTFDLRHHGRFTSTVARIIRSAWLCSSMALFGGIITTGIGSSSGRLTGDSHPIQMAVWIPIVLVTFIQILLILDYLIRGDKERAIEVPEAEPPAAERY